MRILFLASAVLLVGCASEATPPVSTVVDYAAVPYDCVASLTDLSTGEDWEVPSPCHNPAEGVCVRSGGSGDSFRAWAGPCTVAELAGCEGAITVEVTDKGVKSSCVPDSWNPSVQS